MALKRVLIANRGEIAVRLIHSCKNLGITSIAIYTEEDVNSLHVRLADESWALRGRGSRGYLDSADILHICHEHAIQAVIPGYGFLSESAEFAKLLEDSNILFVGPTSETIEDFGLKHRARELAVGSNVPVVPGTGIIQGGKEAIIKAAETLGYPVMVKATAGGGGMGLRVCHNDEELEKAIVAVRSRSEALFKDSGLFLEKYVKNSRHIEAQIFGNGKGDILFLGERECSIQRRHQKLLEETPSPFILRHPSLRDKVREYAVSLTRSVKYKSAGTIEFLVDNDMADIYFLEMNARLQVEHGITEFCYNVDLVDLMLLQAVAELSLTTTGGGGGLSREQLFEYERSGPLGHAMEARIYAENPAKNFAPTPGLLQKVSFPERRDIRIDTWVETGTYVSPAFDPLVAKVMVHALDRPSAIERLRGALFRSIVQGPPTNIDLILQFTRSADFVLGNTLTDTLEHRFNYIPCALEFIEPGAYTTVQDYPGRVDIPNGVPISGPMDSLSFRLANILVGNDMGTEAFEISLIGPRIVFHAPADIALCGAPFSFTISKKPAKLWMRHHVFAGTEISIGETTVGARAYLAIRGGFPDIAEYLGSKSTTPSLKWGGYQGRTIQAGDFISMSRSALENINNVTRTYELPGAMMPKFDPNPTIYALPGPYFSTEFLSPEGQAQISNTEYKISYNSNRGAVRLEGPPPAWSRETGGEGGSHPSNVLGYPYPLGGASFAGDSAVIFHVDGANQSGFMSTHTLLRCDLWRLSQLRPGEPLRFRLVTWEQAVLLERRVDDFLSWAKSHLKRQGSAQESPVVLDWSLPHAAPGDGILWLQPADPNKLERSRLTLRQAGDRGILCDYGEQILDLNHRARVQQLVDKIENNDTPRGFSKVAAAENNAVLVSFDPHELCQSEAVQTIISIESQLPPTRTSKIPSRIFRLPLLFDAKEIHESAERYMKAQRPYAAYLPDNVDFLRRSNGLATKDDVRRCYLDTPLILNAVGFLSGLPIMVQVDPRRRLSVPKFNPTRTVTPGGAVGTGGNTSAIYPDDLPGGYVLFGMTLTGCPWDMFGKKPGYQPDRPWLFKPFDQVIFYNVAREEYDDAVKKFRAGLWDFDVEETVFDMSAYNRLVDETREEVDKIREVQDRCTTAELARERELMAQWKKEKEREENAGSSAGGGRSSKHHRVGETGQDINVGDKHKHKHEHEHEYIPLKANLNARLWKLLVEAGDEIRPGAEVAVLEVMKMEVKIHASGSSADDGVFVVHDVPVVEGETLDPGSVVMWLRVVQA